MADGTPRTSDSVFASLVGSAAGDALGLPYENLSASRSTKLLGPPDRFRMALGRGMVSDDAEHACMTAAAFASYGGDIERFRRDLARRLRWWILAAPPGVGLATLKSIVRLWLGISPKRSGVWSAGNGPAMRAAVLGRVVDRDSLFVFVEASTLITHRDPLAVIGAYAVALASARFAESSRPPADEIGELVNALRKIETPALAKAIDWFAEALTAAAESIARDESTPAFADHFCRKAGSVSGYILETVPIALHAAYRSHDAHEAIAECIRCGGDTDSVASIAGGIVGMNDPTLLAKLMEWPCDERWLRKLSEAAANGSSPPRFPTVLRLPRNAMLLAIVLAHVARRCFPPY